MKPRRSSYKVTFLDRHGPAGMLRVKAMGYGAAVGGLSFPMFVALYDNMLKFGGWQLLVMVLGSSLLMGYVAMTIGLRSGDAAGDAARYFTAGGSSTPYEEAYSHEQALIMQRDFDGAAACFEQRITLARDNPEGPEARLIIAAADVYREHTANATRSAELYRLAQKHPRLTPGQDVYVANKLADLYLGPLKQSGKALVEFRRLIERYPNSRTADQARMALANVKRDFLEPDAG
jgi:outer membrane protein assembly factor BamD (BamD/ComL family)